MQEKLPLLSLEEKSLIGNVLEEYYAHSPREKESKKTTLPARNNNSSENNATTEYSLQALDTALLEYCSKQHIVLGEQQAKEVKYVLCLSALHAGPLTHILNDPQLEEIGITGIGLENPVRVYVANQGWMETRLYFTSVPFTIALLNKLARESGKRLSAHTPTINAILQNGNRLHASIQPVCAQGVEASIRKFVIRAQKPGDLITHQALTPEALSFLIHALKTDCNMLIVGNTGSGKTTTLNALMSYFPLSERMILVEEIPELQLPHPHLVRLVSNPSNGITMPFLIRETLRMRPDRVVIGEIRFPEEGHAFMEAVLAGQGKGTYATFHGHSSQEAVARLLQFGLLSQDVAWINILVVQRRWSSDAKNNSDSKNNSPKNSTPDWRAITQIAELDFSQEQNRLRILPIFNYDYAEKKLVKVNSSVLVEQNFSACFPNQNFEESLLRQEKEWQKKERM